MNSQIYRFYNEETGQYLSYDNRTVILSKTPKDWTIKSNGNDGIYIYAGDTELLLDIDNAIVSEGTRVKIWECTGYNVQVWRMNRNSNGTYTFLSEADKRYCLGFKNGKAVLQIRRNGNSLQEWKAFKKKDKAAENYCSFKSKGGRIELQLPLGITKVISKVRLDKWANDLEKAYESYYELTHFLPFKTVVVEAYKPIQYSGYVLPGFNTIHIDNRFIYDDLGKMALRRNDWNFCALHEMSHLFDNNRPWCFEAELMADLKLAYVLEMNGASAAPAEFPASVNFCGKAVMNAYKKLGTSFTDRYDVFGCAYRFLQIKEVIGWEPFQQTFFELQRNYEAYSKWSKQERFENFVQLVTLYSREDVRSYFSAAEWRTILARCRA